MKIYLIGLYFHKEDAGDAASIIKATISYEVARQYVLDQIENYSSNADFTFYECETKYCWQCSYKAEVGNKETECVMTYRIEPIDLIDSEDVPGIRRPLLEKRCEALGKQNDDLRNEIAELRKNNSAARCYLTFYDGGKYEDFDHVLDCMRTADSILKGGKQGNDHIIELFEGWKRAEDKRKT